jgi:hypothetical protein
MPRENASTITSASCANARSSAPSSSGLDHLRDPDRGAEPRRLDEHRQPSRPARAHRLGLALPARLAHGA